MSEPFRVITHGYQESRGSFPPPREVVDISNDFDSSKLSSLLSDMDQLKREILERMHRMEAVSQAKNLLREDSVKTEALTAKIAEIQKVVRVTQPGPELMTLSKPQAVPISQQPNHDFGANEPPQSERWPENRSGFRPLQNQIETSIELAQNSSVRNDSADPMLVQDDGSHSETNPTGHAVNDCPEEAEKAWRNADASLQEAKRILEEATLKLKQACAKEEQAANELRSTQQELTTAYQFAAAAAQMQKEATLYSRKTTMWATGAVSLAWVAVLWIGWSIFRTRVTIFAPVIGTAFLVGIGFALQRWSNKED